MDMGFFGGDYKWKFNPDAVSVSIDPEEFGGYLEGGFYQYYTDLANNCFYFHISYSESSLEDNGDNDVCLYFNIQNSLHEYSLRVDEYTDGAMLNAFNVHVDFSGVMYGGQDVYVGIELLNKDDKKLDNRLDFSLSVNDNTYQLCGNGDIELPYGAYIASQIPTKESTTKETTTKTTTTRPSTTEPTTAKETTTKQAVTNPSTTAENTTKKETTTKFKYTPTTSNQTIAEQTTSAQTTADQTVANQMNTEQSTTAQTSSQTTANQPSSGGQSAGNQIGNAQNGTGQNTTKAPASTSEKTTKSKAEATTKFKYSASGNPNSSDQSSDGIAEDNGAVEYGNNFEDNNVAAIGQIEGDQTEAVIISPETNGAAGLSPQAKLLTAMAVIFAVSGTAIIARSLSSKKKNPDQNNEEE